MSHNTRTHTFSVIAAEVAGVKAAIILDYIFTATKEAATEYKMAGKSWVRASRKELKKLFPYMSERQIRTTLEKLVDEKYIEAGNFNVSPYDRTLWYALTDKGLEIFEERGRKSNEI